MRLGDYDTSWTKGQSILLPLEESRLALRSTQAAT